MTALSTDYFPQNQKNQLNSVMDEKKEKQASSFL